ncbi:MAG: flagellar biosynthesis anti-sigma factor FlgM [Pararobbsia sp.]
MKIDPSVSKKPADIGNLKESPARPQPDAVPAQASPVPASVTSQGSDEVNLSALSSSLRSGGSAAGDISSKTIEQIKTAISNNQLPIDTSKIADGLLDTVRSFLKTS